MRSLIIVAAAAVAVCSAAEVKAADREWKMFDRRLGMFIHWGIYSVNGWHEQEEMRKRLPRTEYEKCAARFTAERFNADNFVAAAKSAGAQYIVFTAKHHDGFCMWDTAYTDFKVTNTPARRDILAELAASCRRGGVKLGLYYSNPDWHHPNAHNALSTHQIPLQEGDEPDMDTYRAYVRSQVTELLTRYGEIVCFFWDIPTKVDDPGMNELVRRLQPGIMVNNRGWSGDGDYSTPERGSRDGGVGAMRFIEACDSVGARSWGFRENEDYRTVGYLTRAIDRFLSEGANYLLNVGPKSDGTIPEESARRLAAVGSWFSKVRESYVDVEVNTNLVADARCRVTCRDRFVYLHYPDGLDATGLDLYPLGEPPREAVLLNTGAKLAAEVVPMPSSYKDLQRPVLHVYGIPADSLANESVVVRLEFETEAKSLRH